jgi:hypothetical protein
VPSCTDIPKSLDLENSYRDVDDSKSQQSLNNSFNDETRNVRSRRGRSNVRLFQENNPYFLEKKGMVLCHDKIY